MVLDLGVSLLAICLDVPFILGRNFGLLFLLVPVGDLLFLEPDVLVQLIDQVLGTFLFEVPLQPQGLQDVLGQLSSALFDVLQFPLFLSSLLDETRELGNVGANALPPVTAQGVHDAGFPVNILDEFVLILNPDAVEAKKIVPIFLGELIVGKVGQHGGGVTILFEKVPEITVQVQNDTEFLDDLLVGGFRHRFHEPRLLAEPYHIIVQVLEGLVGIIRPARLIRLIFFDALNELILF